MGFAIITGIWGHVLVRVLAFPQSTWSLRFVSGRSDTSTTYEPWLLLGVYVATITLYF